MEIEKDCTFLGVKTGDLYLLWKESALIQLKTVIHKQISLTRWRCMWSAANFRGEFEGYWMQMAKQENTEHLMYTPSLGATCLASSEGSHCMPDNILALAFYPDILKIKKSHKEQHKLCSIATSRKDWQREVWMMYHNFYFFVLTNIKMQKYKTKITSFCFKLFLSS